MPITYPETPARGLDVAKRNLDSILQSAAGRGVLKGHQVTEAFIGDAHRSYFVRLDDLAKGRMLATAQQVAWRYLVYVADQAVAEIELSSEPSGGDPKFLALYEGPFAGTTDQALRTARSFPWVNETDYEVRYLKIPSVYFAAIWLQSDRDARLIPLHHPPGKLKENQAYTEQQVVEELRGIAKETQAFDRKASPRKRK